MENTSRTAALPASHLPATAGTLPGLACVAGNGCTKAPSMSDFSFVVFPVLPVSYGLAQFDFRSWPLCR